jgi:hypothetical protein
MSSEWIAIGMPRGGSVALEISDESGPAFYWSPSYVAAMLGQRFVMHWQVDLRGPLLEAMQRESRGKGSARVFADPPPTTGEYGLANMIRAHIEAAGIDREELRLRTKTSRWIVFHDLRATGAVWRFKRNGSEDTITDVMEDGGWTNLGTVQKYLRLARYMTGAPFPQLPERLLASPVFISPAKAPRGYSRATNLEKSVGAVGIELPSQDPEMPRNVAESSESAPANSPGATVGDGPQGPEAVPASPTAAPADTDDEIFAAFKVAKAAGDVERARALLDLLEPKTPAPDTGSVTSLALVRGEGGQQ